MPCSVWHPDDFVEIAHLIWRKLHISFQNSHDIFFDNISTTIWQSPRELAINWMMRIAPTEWKSLQEMPNDAIEVRRNKEAIRRWLLSELYQVLGKMWMNPTFIQSMSTRLLVRNTIAYALPTNDQDRVITAELMTTFPLWRSLLSTITLHDIATDERPIIEMPVFYTNENGEVVCHITVEGHRDPIESLPGLSIGHDVVEKNVVNGWYMHTTEHNISRILISQNILRRHNNIIDHSDKEYKIRSAVITGLGGIPIFKKKGFWNKSIPKEPEWAWQANPA